MGSVVCCVRSTDLKNQMGLGKEIKLTQQEIVAKNSNEGRTGGVSGTIHRRKNNESRITDIEISFSRITKISTLLSRSYAANSV